MKHQAQRSGTNAGYAIVQSSSPLQGEQAVVMQAAIGWRPDTVPVGQ